MSNMNVEPPGKLPWRLWLFPAFVCSVAILSYLAVPSFGFVFDDRVQILNNPTLLHFSAVPQYFLHHVWHYAPGITATYYRPLFSSWLNVNYALFGPHPAGWHAILLALHILASVLTYSLISQVSGDRRIGFVTALLFAVHPAHVESVAWVSGGTDPLATVFVLGSFLVYRKAQEAREWVQAAMMSGSLLLFACSLLTKETALLFPLLLLLDAFWLVRKPPRSLRFTGWIALYFALAAAYCFARIAVLGSFGWVHVHLPVSTLLYTWPSLLLAYVGLMLFPAGLSPFYDTPYINSPRFWHFWIPVLALIGSVILVSAAIAQLTRGREEAAADRRLYHFLMAWTLIFLAPALDLSVLDAGEIVHDRYLYCASIGFLAIAALMMVRLAERLSIPGRIQATAAGTLILSLTAMTAAQSYYWKNDLALYRRGAAMAPGNINAQSNLATIYLESGHIPEGIAIHRQILEDHPDFVDSYYNLGMAYYNQRDFFLAEKYFERAVRFKPDPTWYFNLGLAQLKNAHTSAAEGSLLRAVQGRPNEPEFHAALGFVYEAEGKTSQALQAFQAAQQLDPSNPAARREIAKIRQSAHPQAASDPGVR